MDAISSDRIAEYVTRRREASGKRGRTLQVASLNRELQVLRRIFHLAQEWGRVERALPNVKMIPGENHRERVLTPAEEALYLRGASTDAMEQYADSALLRDVATILLDCGLRPEECFRLRAENVSDGKLEIHFGKTENARRRIPMTLRAKATLEMRLARTGGTAWVFPAPTKSGYRAVISEEAAHQGHRGSHTDPKRGNSEGRRAARAVRTLHVATHMPNTLGATHGPVDPRVPRGP